MIAITIWTCINAIYLITIFRLKLKPFFNDFSMIYFLSKSNTLFYCLFLVNWRKYFMLWIAIRHLWCCTFFSALLIGIFSLSPSSFLPSSYLDTRCRWNAFNNHDVSGMGPHKEPIRVEFFFYFCRWDDTQWQHKVRQFFFFAGKKWMLSSGRGTPLLRKR